MRATALPDVLRDAGLEVNVLDGFAGRGYSLHNVRGIVWHHTATSTSVADSSVLRVLRDGRAGIPGPLSQLGIDRDGVWHCIADGRANHAGRGSWPGLNGNADTLGVEAFYAGTSSERWNTGQLASMRVGTAAICHAWDIDPSRFLIGHKEWAPTRKIDPYQLHMPNERRTVADIIKEATTMAGTTSNPAFQESFDKAVDAGVFSQHTDPLDKLTAEKLAVFLDRAGVLDPASPAGQHTHTASVRLD